MDFKKKMKRKGEWHSAWGSAVEDRRCERGHKQASKSLQGANSLCLDLLAASMTSRRPARPFAAWGAPAPSDDQCQIKKKSKISVAKGLVSRT